MAMSLIWAKINGKMSLKRDMGVLETRRIRKYNYNVRRKVKNLNR